MRIDLLMNPSSETDLLLVERIRQGNHEAWSDLISRFEGRLLAFVESRIGHRSSSEDVVQETLIGFLTSLPNYDPRRPLEGYLFSICAHKLTDHLRREGRRPTLVPLSSTRREEDSTWQFPANMRPVSSLVRSTERRQLEEKALVEALQQQIERWKERGDWVKLQCIELLFVRGWTNKDVAQLLDLSEQQVANFKCDFLLRTRSLIRQQGLPADVFPEVSQDS